MKLKPKTTTLSPRALVYKRFTNIEKSMTATNAVYVTNSAKAVVLRWMFDYEQLQFIQITQDFVPANANIINVYENNNVIFNYSGNLFQYDFTAGAWEQLQSADIATLDLLYNNIGKYQTNRYYYTGSFTYVMKTDEEGTTVQYVKGNITPLTTFSIKYFNDYINLSQDDLVVIEGRLYSVENPERVHKHMPKGYYVYYATLNSLL